MAAELKPYRAYKDSGVEWLGTVPAHWEVARLKRPLANVVEQAADLQQAGTVVALENVESWTGQVVLADSGVSLDSQLKRFRPGDVLFGKLRPYLAKVAQLPHGGLCVGEFLVLRPRHGKAMASYFEHLLRSKPIIDAVTASTFGAKMPRADWGFVGGMPVVSPPLAEQAAIVRFLDHADRRIRRYIRAKQKLIALLEDRRQALIEQAVTGQIDVGTGRPYQSYRPSSIEWLDKVPAHWEVVPFKRCVAFREGPGIMAADFRQSGVPLLRISCLRKEMATLSGCNFLDPDMVEKRWSHFTVREGDHLLSASGSTGMVSVATGDVVGAIPYTGIIRLWSRSERTAMPYVRLFMSSRLFRDQIDVAKSGVGIEHFGPKHLNRMVLVLPPADEQGAVVVRIRKTVAPLTKAIAGAHREIDLLREYRTCLIANVVTGKLDVREAAAELARRKASVASGAEGVAADALGADANCGLEDLHSVLDEGQG